MDALNVPIQVIFSCDTLGNMTPLRFRYEDEDHNLKTIELIKTSLSVPQAFAGINAILFTCMYIDNKIEKFVELKYFINWHRWVLFRYIN